MVAFWWQMQMERGDSDRNMRKMAKGLIRPRRSLTLQVLAGIVETGNRGDPGGVDELMS